MNELGPEARAVIEAGRHGDDPTAVDRARIRASLLASIAAGGAGAGTLGAARPFTMGGDPPYPPAQPVSDVAAGAKAGGLLASGWKVLLTVVVIGAAGAGVAMLRGRPAPAALAPVTTVAEAPAATEGDPAQPLAIGAMGNSAPAAAAPAAVAPAAAAAAPAAAAPAPASEEPPPAPSHAVRREATLAGNPAPPVPVAVAPAAARAGDGPVAPAPPAAVPPAAAAAPSAEPDTLAAEDRSLREARAALRGGDASRALSLLDEKSAAGAQLREERAAARILALCKLGRVDDARAAAARLLADSPRSPMADRVRASCAGR